MVADKKPDPEATAPDATAPGDDSGVLVEHFFRHESARLTSVLTRALGLRHLDLVEDLVQLALVEALEAWKLQGAPRDPSAWIFRVARNKALDIFRRRETRNRFADEVARLELLRGESATANRDEEGGPVLESEIRDSQLRMIFVYCREELPLPSQVALTLRILCGLGVGEIARALLTSEANVKKRITRAKRKLRDGDPRFEVPSGDRLRPRLDAVHTVLYLLFNEGYYSSHPDRLIRRELCEEAARLCHLLTEHPLCGTPETHALLALMLLHAARFDARLDNDGGTLLLDEQDRGRWNAALIAEGVRHLDRSARGESLSRFHLEAAISAHHCAAPSFEATDWRQILDLYDQLLTILPSPLYELNRAIVLAQLEGPESGIAAIRASEALTSLSSYPLRDATLGELHLRAGQPARAVDLFRAALDQTTSGSERRHLLRRLDGCTGSRLPVSDSPPRASLR